MKTLKTMLLVVAITLGSVLTTNATEEATLESKAITSEISTLLEKPNFTVEEDVQAYVRLVLNENNEMVVLYVNSENNVVNNFIKKRLNYKKVSLNVINKDQEYIVPVRISPIN